MEKKIFLILIFFMSALATSQNPIITHLYTADPSARVFNDTLYLYPSHDRDEAVWWDMVDWHVFSTVDMETWTDHGIALSLSDVKWAEKYAWAPDCHFKNGKYYFYFPTDQDYIGVAVGKSPGGPFEDPLGKPIITRDTPGVKATRDLIDPAIFIDEDGQAYLFFGQNDVNVVLLNEDMVSFNGPVKILEGTDHFFEAVWVHKYRNKYYLSYSGDGKIMYCMGDHPLGPYTFKGEILGPVNSGTNHHSIVEYKGQWYLFYHNADLALEKIPEDSEERKYIQWRRSVCVEYLYYNTDGTIQKVEQTKEGVNPIKMSEKK
jgi:arabinoxylan arabinofuranohydrolase